MLTLLALILPWFPPCQLVLTHQLIRLPREMVDAFRVRLDRALTNFT